MNLRGGRGDFPTDYCTRHAAGRGLAVDARPLDQPGKDAPVAFPPLGPEAAGCLLVSFEDDIQHEVVRRALKARKRLGGGVRSRLDACLRTLRVAGFRDASKAPLGSLAMPVHEAMRLGHDELTAAVLEAWALSREPLHAARPRILRRLRSLLLVRP